MLDQYFNDHHFPLSAFLQLLNGRKDQLASIFVGCLLAGPYEYQAACLIRSLGLEQLQCKNVILESHIQRVHLASVKCKQTTRRTKVAAKMMKSAIKKFQPLKRPAQDYYTIDSEIVQVVNTKADAKKVGAFRGELALVIKCDNEKRVSVIQLASDRKIWIFHVCKIEST